MKISWHWLTRHVDLSGLDPRQMADRFTMSVAELEGIEELGATFDKVLTARVTATSPHPHSDKLTLVEMDLGPKRLTAVSGAPGIRVGTIIPLALPGCVLEGLEGRPEVRVVELKGVVSPGVTCSEKELGISEDHSGLMELPEGTPLGVPLTQVLPVHDFVLEIDNKSMTHRPDLWSHRGIAREIAALAGRQLLPFEAGVPEVAEDPLSVHVEAPDLCPRYTAQLFDGVKVAESPLWMKLALNRVGIRPISNVVDITNFVMMDLGNPTHAFDARFLADRTIRVRRAQEGEVLKTLDGCERPLIPSDVVIADGRRGVALGGVMGGENSEIQPDTAAVVLEAACFNASAIRRTSARLGLRTEASARFEKGQDRLLPVLATALFSRLLRQLCPTARVASRFYDVAAEEPAPTVIRVAPSFINRKLGTTLEASRMKAMLEGIEFQVTQEEDLFTIVVPTFRATRDIRIPEDVVEEIGRLHGFDNIVPQPLTAPVAPTPVVPSRPLERRARQSLVADGYCEVMTYSFASASQLELLGCSLHGAVTLKNPISSDFPGLRRALMPGLLGLAVKNGLARDDFRLFEVGRVFFPAPAAGEIPAQRRHVAGLIYSKSGDHFEAYRLLKGHVENLFGRLGRSGLEFHPVTGAEQAPWVVPSKARTIRLAGAECGVVGMLNPYVRARTKMRGKVVFFELDLDVLLRARPGPVRFEPLPRFPAIENDLSVIVGQEIPYEQVEGIIRHAGGELLEGLELFAAFRGQPIPEGKKSLSFHLRFRSPSRTLQDQEVAPLVQHILAAVQQGVGGEIRTA